MMNNSPSTTTRRIGKSQGYLGLSVTDTVLDDGSPVMMTSWQPTPKEAEAVAAGAPIYLWVLGTAHPPVMLTVGSAPGDWPIHTLLRRAHDAMTRREPDGISDDEWNQLLQDIEKEIGNG